VIVTAGEALVDIVDGDGAVRPVAGGGPFNTAIALGRLEVDVAFLGTLSRDDYGQLLARQLIEAGVDVSLVRWSDLPTPRAEVRRQADGRHDYTFHLSDTSLVDLSTDGLPLLPEEAWALHVGTLALAVDPPARTYEALVHREAGRRRIIFDPNVRPEIFGDVAVYRRRFERIARLADLVKLSDDDAGWLYPGVPVDTVVRRVLGLGPGIVAVTLGERGAVAGSGPGFVEVPAIPVVVADTVGAGDSFGAALIAALVDADAFGPERSLPAEEAVLARAVAYAVAASALTCTRVGAVPPSRDEIEAQLRAAELTAGGA
jgi:fructokinase